MEVSGVLMSWDTLVISSAFMRSLRVCSATAFCIPSLMLFSASA